MIRTLLLSTFVAGALLSLPTVANANSSSELISSFAHIKHAQLYVCGKQDKRHSLGSHSGWAKGQAPKVVKKEILRQAAMAYSCLVNNPRLSKDALVNGFAYAKQGTLIALRKTGRQHSIGSHTGWARGQQAQTIRAEIARQFDASHRQILKQL